MKPGQHDRKEMHTFLAIDLGASNGRVIIGRLSADRLWIDQAHRFDHEIIDERGVKRWDWPRIRDQVRTGLRAACDMVGETPIRSVSCDAWGQDFGLLDEGGELFYPPVSYRDSRTDGMPHSFAEIISPLDLRKRTGSGILGMTALCQLRAMVQQEPDVLQRARLLLHIPDLIHYDLCGERATDWTMATASQLRNVKTGEWDHDLIHALGIPSRILPRVAEHPAILGQIDAARAPHPALAGVPVISTAGHDTAAIAAAIHPMAKGTLFLSAGTWCIPGVCTGGYGLPDSLTDASIIVLGLALNKWALFHGGMGFWLLQECRRTWAAQGFVRSYDDLVESAARSRINSLIEVNQPRLFTPGDMVVKIASACRETGQEVPAGPEDYTKVILDSLANGVTQSVNRLKAVTGMTFNRLHMVGGGTRNRYFCRQLSRTLGAPVLAGPTEATAIGNILLQARTLGILADENDMAGVLKNSFQETVYEE